MPRKKLYTKALRAFRDWAADEAHTIKNQGEAGLIVGVTSLTDAESLWRLGCNI